MKVKTLKLYRVDSVFEQGAHPVLSKVNYEIVGVDSNNEVLIFQDGDTGESVGLYVSDKDASILVEQVYDSLLSTELKKFLWVNDRNDEIVMKSNVARLAERRRKKQKTGVSQFSYLSGWASPNAFKRQPLPKTTLATLHPSYNLIGAKLETLSRIASGYMAEWLPEWFEAQKTIVKSNRFNVGDKVVETGFYSGLWTSMIFNINSAVGVHMDRKNMRRQTVVTGGQLVLCDYSLRRPENPSGQGRSASVVLPVFKQRTGDLILYPAYKSYHGVTRLLGDGRATLVFYALRLS
jgi:hypothetical protein